MTGAVETAPSQRPGAAPAASPEGMVPVWIVRQAAKQLQTLVSEIDHDATIETKGVLRTLRMCGIPAALDPDGMEPKAQTGRHLVVLASSTGATVALPYANARDADDIVAMGSTAGSRTTPFRAVLASPEQAAAVLATTRACDFAELEAQRARAAIGTTLDRLMSPPPPPPSETPAPDTATWFSTGLAVDPPAGNSDAPIPT